MGIDHANDGRRLRQRPEAPARPALDGERIGKRTGLDAAVGAPAHVGKATLTGTLYRHAAEASAIDHDDPHIGAALARAGGGHALSATVRAPLEQQLGYSLDRVRVHTDGAAAAAARALGAEAFTIGEDIYFADGTFAPETQAGQQLIAHEVMHVVQAWEGRTRRGGGLQVSDPGEALEREAEAAAMQARAVHALAGSHAHAPRSAPAAGASSLVLRKRASHTKHEKVKPAAPPVVDDPLIAGVMQVLDRAAARIPAAPAAAPASVPKAIVEIDYAHIVVKARPPQGQAPAPQAPAPQAPAPTASHGGTRTVDGSTLEVAMTRLAIPTTYRLGLAYPSQGERAAMDEIETARAALAGAKKLVAEAKAKAEPPKAGKGKAKQPAVSAEDKAQAVKDLPALEAKVAELEEQIATKDAALQADAAAHTKKQLDAQVSGDKDANEFWCSGLSIWTLAASGYDINQPLRGAEDGQPFKYQPRKGGKPQVVTLKQLVDGEPAAVEVVTKIQRDKLTKGAAQIIELTEDVFLGGHRLGYGADGEAVSDAVKGAAGAFALFGLGTEIAAGAQKPGDFAQRREASALNVTAEIGATKKKLADKKLDEATKKELEDRLAMLQSENGTKVQQGKGHAWQVTEVRAEGQALFGAQGSPRLLAGKVPTAPAWLEGVTFAIERTTRPELVGAHVVDAERKIEANIASSTGTAFGTVRETDELHAPKSKKAKPAEDRHDSAVFYGRLAESPWATWRPATEASARAFLATQDAAPASD